MIGYVSNDSVFFFFYYRSINWRIINKIAIKYYIDIHKYYIDMIKLLKIYIFWFSIKIKYNENGIVNDKIDISVLSI